MESTDHTTNHSNGDDAVKKEESGAEAVALTNEIKTVTEGTQMNADSKDLENVSCFIIYSVSNCLSFRH
jgi:hypothetical protein